MILNLAARITLFIVKWSPWVQDDQFVQELAKVYNEQQESKSS